MAGGNGGHGLSLTRREGESVLVEEPGGKQLLITVERVESGRVHLRFVGSRETFNVARMELRLRAHREA